MVGVGDDEDEVSQIILFESKDMLVERFNLLLPEFNLKIDFNFEKQSKKTLLISLIKSLIIMGIVDLIVFVIYELNLFTNMQVILIGNLILVVFLLVVQLYIKIILMIVVSKSATEKILLASFSSFSFMMPFRAV